MFECLRIAFLTAFDLQEWAHLFSLQQFYRHRMHGFQNALSSNDRSVPTEIHFYVTRDRHNAPRPLVFEVREVSLCNSAQDGSTMNFKPHFVCLVHHI